MCFFIERRRKANVLPFNLLGKHWNLAMLTLDGEKKEENDYVATYLTVVPYILCCNITVVFVCLPLAGQQISCGDKEKKKVDT